MIFLKVILEGFIFLCKGIAILAFIGVVGLFIVGIVALAFNVGILWGVLSVLGFIGIFSMIK